MARRAEIRVVIFFALYDDTKAIASAACCTRAPVAQPSPAARGGCTPMTRGYAWLWTEALGDSAEIEEMQGFLVVVPFVHTGWMQAFAEQVLYIVMAGYSHGRI